MPEKDFETNELVNGEVGENPTKSLVPRMPIQSPLIKRLLSVCLILIGISTTCVFAMGISGLSIKKEIEDYKYFVSVAKDARPNFENSLIFYTGETQKIIDYLLNLRPDTEEDYITFLTALEKLGKDLSLDLIIKSVEESEGAASMSGKSEPSQTLGYDINFYGSIRDLRAVLKGIAALPYYVKIDDIRYENPSDGSGGAAGPGEVAGSADRQSGEKIDRRMPNARLQIKLYIK